MKPLKVRDLELDDSSFNICVTLTSRNEYALMNDLLKLKGKAFDLMEWRADYYTAHEENKENLILKPLKLIKKLYNKKPLIATFRDISEGGQRDMEPDKLLEIRTDLIASGFVDIIDLELMNFRNKEGQEQDANKEYQNLLRQAKEKGVKVILSAHDFIETPDVQKIIEVLKLEEECGADLAKIACFAKDESDAKKLLDASAAAAKTLLIPHIAIAMGEEGEMTRVSKRLSSSAVTFASITESSAPGQLSLDELHEKIQ